MGFNQNNFEGVKLILQIPSWDLKLFFGKDENYDDLQAILLAYCVNISRRMKAVFPRMIMVRRVISFTTLWRAVTCSTHIPNKFKFCNFI